MTAKANSSIIPEVPVKDIAETRPITVIGGPIWDNIKNIKILVCIQHDYYIPKTYIDSIGLSTYMFNNRHQQVLNWQNCIRDHILPNYSQWEDFGYHRMTTTNIKRYLIATQWSIGRASPKKKMCLGVPASIRMHEIALCTLCPGNELFCTLAPAANVDGFCVLLQSHKALRSCCNLAKLYVQDGIFVQFMSQRYIWRILHHVEDLGTFTFITHTCNIWLGT